MDYCNELKRITNELFDRDAKVLYLLSKLSNIGVIAGGSVVFALNSFVPKETVGDIDVFVTIEGDFWKCLDIIYKIFPNCKFFINNINHTNELDQEINNGRSIIDIKLTEEDYCPLLQIILSQFISPMELLDGFDIDYAQCGIHDSELYITKYCRESHKQRKILRVKPTIKYGRLLKATKKGFNSILFKNPDAYEYNEYNKVSITWEQICHLKINFLEDTSYSKLQLNPDEKMVLTETAFLSRILDEERCMYQVNSIAYYLNIKDIDDTLKKIRVYYFSYEINILDIGEKIYIENNSNFTNELISDYDDDIFIGNNILIIKPLNLLNKDRKITFIVHDIYKMNKNILPIEFDFDYEFKSEFKNLNVKAAKRK